MEIWAFLLAIGVPTSVVGFAVHRIEKKLDKETQEREERDKARRQYERYQVKMLTATAALSKANALALKNGKCNGETEEALEYLDEVKHDQRDFLAQQGIDHLF